MGIKSSRKIFNFALILADYGKIKNLALAISKIIVYLPALMLYETLYTILCVTIVAQKNSQAARSNFYVKNVIQNPNWKPKTAREKQYSES